MAAIYVSVNLPPWKMKFTLRGKIPQVKNHWARFSKNGRIKLWTRFNAKPLILNYLKSS